MNQPETMGFDKKLPMTSVPLTASIQPRMLTAAYYLSFILLGLATAAEGPSLPTLARHTASPLSQISLIFVFGALGYLLGTMAGGWLYDRLPGHRVIASAMVLILVAALFFPLATRLWFLLLSAFCLGLGKGTLDVGCNALLQWLHGDKVGPYMNGLHFCFGLGSFLSPILLAQIISTTGEIYWVFWIIAILTIPMAVWFWFLPDLPARHRPVRQDTGVIRLVPVLLIVLAFFIYVGAETGFANWIYTYAITLKLATTIGAAYLTSAFWGSFTIGRFLGVWITTRARSQTILFADLAGGLGSLGLIILAHDSQILVWTGSILFGLSLASIFPTILILAGESMQINGLLTGWFLVGAALGNMFLPWVIGQAFTSIGPHAMMIILMADLALEVLALLILVLSRQSSASRAELPQS